MMDVLLSASVPLPTRDRRYFETADVVAIREAIKALVEVVLPVGRITCGGHPAITPLIALFAREAELDFGRVTIFQSEFFGPIIDPNLMSFVDVRLVPSVGNERAPSLTAMRERMVTSRRFNAAVVIGGMEGVFEEVRLFTRSHPDAMIMPLASTGAAAAVVHQRGEYDEQLRRDLTFSSLFRRRLPFPERDE